MGLNVNDPGCSQRDAEGKSGVKEVKFKCKEVSIKPMDTFGFDEHW